MVSAMGRARRVAGLLLALVAGAAFTGGVIAERVVLAQRELPPAADDVRPPPGMRVLIRGDDEAMPDGERRVRFMLPGHLAQELELTPEQQARMEAILAEDQAAMREIMARMEPELHAVVERSRQRIMEVLTEEQADRWQAMSGPQLRRMTPPQP